MSDQAANNVDFVFESNASKSWVGVLDDSAHVSGNIVSQNAGSTNAGIYYQIGGGGLNERFGDKIRFAGQFESVNATLKDLYNNFYVDEGPVSSWAADSVSERTDRLTSLVVPLNADGTNIGNRVAGMVYSVGPVLDKRGIVDHPVFEAIYYEAIEAMDAFVKAGNPLDGFRITMLSCGIYGDSVDDKNKLFVDAATDIISGIAKGLTDYPQKNGFKILINTNDNRDAPNERSSFSSAATALGLSVSDGGISFDPAALVERLDAVAGV